MKSQSGYSVPSQQPGYGIGVQPPIPQGRLGAMIKLCKPFATRELEAATTYEEMLTAAIKERDELFKFAVQMAVYPDSKVATVSRKMLGSFSMDLLQKVLQATNA